MEKHHYNPRNQKPVIFRPVIFLFFTFILFHQNSFGQIAAWDFNLAAGNEAAIAATTLNANLNATSVSRGAGIASSALANSYSSTGFDATSIANAQTLNEYDQFTIKANSGYQVSLSTLDANFRRSGTGPTNFQWEYSLDAFATAGINIGSAISYTLTTSNGDAQTQINLSGISALQNVISSTTITIRLYASGASASGGTFALGRLTGNDLAVGGTVALSALAPTKLAITAITPATPTSGNTFSVTVESQDVNSTAANVSLSTGISLSTNGNAGTIGGTTSGTINGGTSSVLISGVTLSGTGGGVTITATRTSGDVLTAGTSNGFSVLPVAPVAAAANPVGPTSFTANWGSVTGAVLYKIDVLSALPYNTEDFTDGNFTSGPAWAGSTANYSVLTNSTLPNGLAPTDGSFLGCNASVGTTSLYTPAAETSQWEFSLGSPDFAPSSGNYFGVVLMSDNTFTSNISSFNGYYIRIGVDGATDYIELWKSTGLTKTQVGSYSGGPNLAANALRDGLNIKLTRNSSGMFQLFYSTGFLYGAVPVTSAGTLTDNTYSASSYFGIFTNFANPAVTRRLYIDNITVTGMGSEVFVPGYSNLAAIDTSQSVTGLTLGQTYYYRVRAVSTGGTSANSNVIPVTTSCPSISLTLNSQTNASCFGNADGAIDMNQSGGTAPYTTSGTGPVFTVIVEPKNHSSPYFGVGNGTGFTVSGVQGKELTLVRGITYSFSVLSPGHPFVISTNAVGGAANSGSVVTSGVTNSGTQNGTLTFTPDGSHPALLYYQCNVHANMGWKINIVDQLTDGDLGDCMAGDYSLTSTDANGCSSAATVDVTINEPSATTFYYDGDGDNYGDDDETAPGCTAPTDFIAVGGDCDDADPGRNPGAAEICGNSIDENCDGIDPPMPAADISGNNTICLGQPTLVHLEFTGTGPWDYTISDGSQIVNGTSAVSPVDTNIIPLTAGNHVYTITAFNDIYCNDIGTGSAAITVNDVPPTGTVSSITGATEACNTDVKLITVNGSSGGPGVTYSWNTGSNSSVVKFSDNIGGPFVTGPFSTAGNTVYAEFGALAGSSGYNICSQAVNGCGSTNNKCTWVRGIVGVPGTITGPVVACPGNTKNYSCGISGGASVYTWTFSVPGAVIVPNGSPYNVNVTFPAFTTGQLCVTAALACQGSSTSAARCVTISNNPIVPGSFTNGPSKICPGATGVTFSVPSVNGATGYNWTTPAGTTITSGQNTTAIQVSFPNPYTGAPPICVSATSACGTSVARCKTVGSNIPIQPGAMAGAPTGVCSSTVQYSVANVTGATSYTWTNPAGTTITTGQGSTTILLAVSPSFTSGFVTVVPNTNLCTPGTGPARTITIYGKPVTPGTIIANPPTWCQGATVNFHIVPPATPLPSFNWTVTNGTITAGQTTSNIDVTWGNGAGNVSVYASNSCGFSTVHTQSFSSGCREEGDQLTIYNGQLTVYPNPAHDKLTVSIDVKETTDLSMQLMDVSGRVVLSQGETGTAGLNTYDLNVSHLSKGVYMLEVKSANDNWKTKVVVE